MIRWKWINSCFDIGEVLHEQIQHRAVQALLQACIRSYSPWSTMALLLPDLVGQSAQSVEMRSIPCHARQLPRCICCAGQQA
jgi:hypothetical protein